MVKTNFGQVTKAIVVDTEDISKRGRIKLRIPSFHGPPSVDHLPSEAFKYWVSDDDLPWAEVMYPIGTHNPSPSIFEKGEVVFIVFTSTSYRHPLVIGTTGKFV